MTVTVIGSMSRHHSLPESLCLSNFYSYQQRWD